MISPHMEAIVLSVFGDESADQTKQRVFAVAGIIGAEHQWKVLEEAWIARTNGVPFHAADCECDKGDFEGRDHSKNLELYKDLAIILAKSGLGGWGFAIDLCAQRKVFPDAPDDLSYYKCFLEVILAMRNCAAYNGETAMFTFDMRQESEYNAGILYNMLATSPEYKSQIFSEISFECSRTNPRIQAADLFAREAMKALDNGLVGPVRRPMRKSWETLYTTERFHVEAISLDWFSGLKENMALLETSVGYSKSEYIQWLNEHGLIDNTTNKFLYMQKLDEER